MMRRRSRQRLLAFCLDYCLPIRPWRMSFVTRHDVPPMGNLRIMLDAMADAQLARRTAASIHNRTSSYKTTPARDRQDIQIALFKNGPLPPDMVAALEAKGIRVFDRFSLRAILFVLSSATVILSHSARDAFIARRRPARRIINLWHGVALKRIELLMPDHAHAALPEAYRKRQQQILQNGRLYDAMIASSAADRDVNARSFGVAMENIHAIGLPRFDYLNADYSLPADLRDIAHALDIRLRGRTLMLYAPTFREHCPSPLASLDPATVVALRAFCRNHQLVLGIRPHPYDRSPLHAICDGHDIIDVGVHRIAECALLLRRAKVLIVDYSSLWVDYLLLRRPIVGFVPDLAAYHQHDRGLNAPYGQLFPGQRCDHWHQVIAALRCLAIAGFPVQDAARLERTANMLLPPMKERSGYTARCLNLIAPALTSSSTSDDGEAAADAAVTDDDVTGVTASASHATTDSGEAQ